MSTVPAEMAALMKNVQQLFLNFTAAGAYQDMKLYRKTSILRSFTKREKKYLQQNFVRSLGKEWY